MLWQLIIFTVKSHLHLSSKKSFKLFQTGFLLMTGWTHTRAGLTLHNSLYCKNASVQDLLNTAMKYWKTKFQARNLKNCTSLKQFTGWKLSWRFLHFRVDDLKIIYQDYKKIWREKNGCEITYHQKKSGWSYMNPKKFLKSP